MSDGLARFVAGDKIGFMNARGEKIITAKFDFALPFSEGLAAFCFDCNQIRNGEHHRVEGGRWGYINKSGEIVVHPEYDKAGPFEGGKAAVVHHGKEIILRKEDIKE